LTLDVVVPTYKRSELLRRAVTSLLRAHIPANLDVSIFVVDNNSEDDTEAVVRDLQTLTSRPLVYIRERNQGISHARNAGIRAGSGDLIGFIDDDEEVDENWYDVVAREFADPTTHFIGGPYLPNWAAPAPDWLPTGYHAVIGVVVPKPRSTFGDGFPGILMGGNAVIRRSAFDRIGLYSTHLGRIGKVLLTDEDAELYDRLCAADVRGMYVPDLIIHHYIPASRLTRNYHRRWCFWRGVSQGSAARASKEPVVYFLGIPRHRIGRAVRGLISLPRHLMSSGEAGLAFKAELASWDLLGFIYGRYFARMDRYYPKK
jgi:glycosyltransferase involved in cell wall biosynthesis